MDKKKISIYLPMDVYEDFKKLTTEKNRSMNEVLNQCVNFILTNYDTVMAGVELSDKLDFNYFKSLEDRIEKLEKKVDKMEDKHN